MNQCELGVAKSGSGVLAVRDALIEAVEDGRSRSGAGFPETGDDVMSPCAKEGPRETNEAFASEVALP